MYFPFFGFGVSVEFSVHIEFIGCIFGVGDVVPVLLYAFYPPVVPFSASSVFAREVEEVQGFRVFAGLDGVPLGGP